MTVSKTILVTGGAGFIGSCFVRQLIDDGDVRVINLDKLTYAGNLDSLEKVADHPNYAFVQGDIGDRAMVAALLEDRQPNAVVNFAAESHVDRSIDGPRVFVETNVMGTLELLTAVREYWSHLSEASRDRFRFLHVSTDEVYGSLGSEGRFTETTAYAPNSPYSASKAASDHLVRAFHHTFGLPVLTTNCSNNYGPYQFLEKLIPLIALNALEGQPLPVYGDGKNVRDWLYVEDHCRAIRLVCEQGRVGEVYNIGSDSECSNLEVVQTICEMVDRLRPDLPHRPCSSLITFVKDRPGHDLRYAIDAGKIRRELGWKPSVRFDEGIERTVRWYLENPRWVERVSSGTYHRERLGLGSGTASRQEEGEGSTLPAGGPIQQAERVRAYRDGPIQGIEFKPVARFSDPRGWLAELYREDELAETDHPVMAYLSQTQPGVSRGPHEHEEQSDYFVFMGPGDFRIYLWDARPDSPTLGCRLSRIVGETDPQAVTVPPGVVHAYQNVSDKPGWVFNAPNRLYAGRHKEEPVDEIRHEDEEGSPFRLS